jgi:hypothetical protein
MNRVRSEGTGRKAVDRPPPLAALLAGLVIARFRGHCYVRRQTMHAIHNGMSARELTGAVWRKSQRSNSQGACVEMARISADTIALRNSRDPQGPALICPRDAIVALVAGLRDGKYDHLVN